MSIVYFTPDVYQADVLVYIYTYISSAYHSYLFRRVVGVIRPFQPAAAAAETMRFDRSLDISFV